MEITKELEEKIEPLIKYLEERKSLIDKVWEIGGRLELADLMAIKEYYENRENILNPKDEQEEC